MKKKISDPRLARPEKKRSLTTETPPKTPEKGQSSKVEKKRSLTPENPSKSPETGQSSKVEKKRSLTKETPSKSPENGQSFKVEKKRSLTTETPPKTPGNGQSSKVTSSKKANNSTKSRQSTRRLTRQLIRDAVPEGQEGEPLTACSDQEWDHSENAYSTELLNVKKKKNRVTVFAAPRVLDTEKAAASVRQKKSRKTEPAKGTSEEELTHLARLFAGIAKTLIEDKEKTQGVEVTVSLKLNSGKAEVVKQA